MFCTKCGKEIQDDAVFCSSCGTKIGSQDSSQGQEGNNQVVQAAASTASIELNSMPPITVNPANIAMFRVKNKGIAMEMDGIWGEKMILYLNQQEAYNDFNKLLAALQHLTKNMVMQFKTEGEPVVPLYRITKVYANDWWKRLELEIEGAGKQWFQYPDKLSLNADHTMLINMMRGIQQP